MFAFHATNFHGPLRFGPMDLIFYEVALCAQCRTLPTYNLQDVKKSVFRVCVATLLLTFTWSRAS